MCGVEGCDRRKNYCYYSKVGQVALSVSESVSVVAQRKAKFQLSSPGGRKPHKSRKCFDTAGTD